MSRTPEPLAALAVVPLIGAGAGCSNASNNDAASGSNAANPTAAGPDEGVKFTECMRANGVPDYPDPSILNAATQKCGDALGDAEGSQP